MADYPPDEATFTNHWSSAAGALSAMKEAIVEVEKRAGEAFIAGKDAIAQAMRDLATVLQYKTKQMGEKVQGYIEEKRRREQEIRRVVGAGKSIVEATK